jgi:hypothetical protein
MVTDGLILIGDAQASVDDFIINELVAGDYAGYTEVKLIPEPSTALLAGFALVSLALCGRRRRR